MPFGQKGPNGLPAKKPTGIISNSEVLLSAFRGIRCNNRHQHDDNFGASRHLHSMQVWPWKLAELLVDGISNLAKLQNTQDAYPETGTGPDDPTMQDADAPWMKCPGCRWRMARGRKEHTREPGVCKYEHYDQEPEWTCPGCNPTLPRQRGRPDRTEVHGECRWAETTSRAVASRKRGSDPREARPKASADPMADVPGPQLQPQDRVEEPGEPTRQSSITSTWFRSGTFQFHRCTQADSWTRCTDSRATRFPTTNGFSCRRNSNVQFDLLRCYAAFAAITNRHRSPMQKHLTQLTFTMVACTQSCYGRNSKQRWCTSTYLFDDPAGH